MHSKQDILCSQWVSDGCWLDFIRKTVNRRPRNLKSDEFAIWLSKTETRVNISRMAQKNRVDEIKFGDNFVPS